MMKPHIALYQPDIPGNTGTILRMAACLGLHVDIIEPAGFDLSERAFRRAGMDYLDMAAMTRHDDWNAFQHWRQETGRRLILLSTKACQNYTQFTFGNSDILMFGRESSGVPDDVHAASDHALTIKMCEGQRSLNLAVSAAMVTGEAIRQLAL